MKDLIILSVFVLFGIIATAFSMIKPEETSSLKSLPSINIETLDGKSINAENTLKNDSPTLLVFWATCCVPCKKELTAISKVYDTWQKETGINIVAVSVELPRYADGVAPFVKSNKWDFDVYLDVERKLMHEMNAFSTPHSFLLNKAGEIVWDKQGFKVGDENAILEKIKEII
ncbi:MAG: TlpA family protein disulfide reductase [Flavobacteriales bacterium]|nr:TlpA family protein disulfide reductase [Flavobacteriales bacterium]